MSSKESSSKVREIAESITSSMYLSKRWYSTIHISNGVKNMALKVLTLRQKSVRQLLKRARRLNKMQSP